MASNIVLVTPQLAPEPEPMTMGVGVVFDGIEGAPRYVVVVDTCDEVKLLEWQPATMELKDTFCFVAMDCLAPPAPEPEVDWLAINRECSD